MSGLFRSGNKPQAQKPPEVAGFKPQTSAYGLSIPLLFGTNRLGVNLLYYSNFQTIAHTSTQSSGGKGGGNNNTVTTTYTYKVDCLLALCETGASGIAEVQYMYVDKDKFANPTDKGYTIRLGEDTQVLFIGLYNYRGICYFGGTFDLGDQTNLKNHTCVVKGLNAYSGQTGSNPAKIIEQILTNAHFGISFGFYRNGVRTPSDNYVSSALTTVGVNNWWNYCVAQGMFFSPILNDQRSVAEIIADLTRAGNGAVVWSNGKLNVRPYGEETITGNGLTYNPTGNFNNNYIWYNLTDDDFVSDIGQDPIRVTRTPKTNTVNSVSVEFTDRDIDYNVNTIDCKDDADINAYGLRKQDTLSMPWVTDKTTAQKIAQTLLQRNIYQANKYEFQLSWRYCLLEPMDLVSLTDLGLGLSQKPVRITSISENENGLLTVQAEDFVFGTATPALFTPQGGEGSNITQNDPAGNTTTPLIINVPYELTSVTSQEVWFALSGGASWGGCEIWGAINNGGNVTEYQMLGMVTGKSRYGVTESALASMTSDQNPVQTAQTVNVSIVTSGGQLETAEDSSRDAYTTAFALFNSDGTNLEVISYTTASLTATSKYTLSNLRRGIYGTQYYQHNTASKFMRLDEAVFRWQVPNQFVGLNMKFKFVSFNTFGKSLQDISTVTAYDFSIAQSFRPQPYSISISISANP